MDEEKIMTKQDVMEYLHLDRQTVDKLFIMPCFPRIRIGKRKSVVKYKDLCAYLDQYLCNLHPEKGRKESGNRN